jgi:hypothetical protein
MHKFLHECVEKIEGVILVLAEKEPGMLENIVKTRDKMERRLLLHPEGEELRQNGIETKPEKEESRRKDMTLVAELPQTRKLFYKILPEGAGSQCPFYGVPGTAEIVEIGNLYRIIVEDGGFTFPGFRIVFRFRRRLFQTKPLS